MINPVNRTDDFVRALAARHAVDLSSKGARERLIAVPTGEEGEHGNAEEDPGREATKQAKALWKAVTDTRAMITRVSQGYTDFGITGMSDVERDAADRAVGEFVAHALKQIDQLKRVAASFVSARHGQHASRGAHLLGIVAFLSDALQQLSRDGQRLRDARIRHALAVRNRPQRVSYDAGEARKLARAAASKETPLARGGAEANSDLLQYGDGSVDVNDSGPVSEVEMREDAHLMQEFKRENATLVNDLVETRERVREAERTVYAIANMNQVFATKVLEQAREIETLYDLAVEASTFTQRGNRELRKLEKKGLSFKYVLAGIAFCLALTLLLVERLSRRRRLFFL